MSLMTMMRLKAHEEAGNARYDATRQAILLEDNTDQCSDGEAPEVHEEDCEARGEPAGQDGTDDGVTTGQEVPPEVAVAGADDGVAARQEAPPKEAFDNADDVDDAGQEAPPEVAVYGADDGVAAGQEDPPDETVDGAGGGVAAGQEAPPEEAVDGVNDCVAADQPDGGNSVLGGNYRAEVPAVGPQRELRAHKLAS